MVRSAIDPQYFTSSGNAGSVATTPYGLVPRVGEEWFRAEVVRPDTLRLNVSR